jgi:hypothetical protein
LEEIALNACFGASLDNVQVWEGREMETREVNITKYLISDETSHTEFSTGNEQGIKTLSYLSMSVFDFLSKISTS